MAEAALENASLDGALDGTLTLVVREMRAAELRRSPRGAPRRRAHELQWRAKVSVVSSHGRKHRFLLRWHTAAGREAAFERVYRLLAQRGAIVK